MRGIIHTNIHPADIFPYQSHHQHQHSSDKHEGGHQGTETDGHHRIYQLLNNCIQTIKESEESTSGADHGGNPQRFFTESRKTVEPQTQELTQCIPGFSRLSVLMLHRHVFYIARRTKNKADYIRVGILVPQHLIHNKTSCRKETGHVQISRLAQHEFQHQIIHPASEIAECIMMLMLIFCIDHIAAFLQALQQILYCKSRSLAVVIHTYQDIPFHLMKTRHQRRMLTEIPRQVYAADVGIFPAEFPDDIEGIIR